MLSRIFLRTPIFRTPIFLQPYYIVHHHHPHHHHHPVNVLCLLLVLAVAPWLFLLLPWPLVFLLLLLLFPRCPSRPHTIFSIILLYSKEAVSRTLYSLSASASRVAVTGSDTALCNLETAFLKNVFIFYIIPF